MRGLAPDQRVTILWIACAADMVALAYRHPLERFARAWKGLIEAGMRQPNPFATFDRATAEFLTTWAFSAALAGAVVLVLAILLGWPKRRAVKLAVILAVLPVGLSWCIILMLTLFAAGSWAVAGVIDALGGSWLKVFTTTMASLERRKDSLPAALAAIGLVFFVFIPVVVVCFGLFMLAAAAPIAGALVSTGIFGVAPWRGQETLAYLLAGSGTLMGLWAGLADGTWRLSQLRQLRSLPSSKVRSAALGLVELKGRVRLLPPPAEAVPFLEVSPFILEDATGRVRVDPSGAKISLGWWLRFGRRQREAVLAGGPGGQLGEGSPVYVLGTLAADGGERVVRPRGDGYDYAEVFFLSDSGEFDARRHLREGFARTVLAAVLWTAFSLANLLLL